VGGGEWGGGLGGLVPCERGAGIHNSTRAQAKCTVRIREKQAGAVMGMSEKAQALETATLACAPVVYDAYLVWVGPSPCTASACSGTSSPRSTGSTGSTSSTCNTGLRDH
jgi:hypothetical protein